MSTPYPSIVFVYITDGFLLTYTYSCYAVNYIVPFPIHVIFVFTVNIYVPNPPYLFLIYGNRGVPPYLV